MNITNNPNGFFKLFLESVETKEFLDDIYRLSFCDPTKEFDFYLECIKESAQKGHGSEFSFRGDSFITNLLNDFNKLKRFKIKLKPITKLVIAYFQYLKDTSTTGTSAKPPEPLISY